MVPRGRGFRRGCLRVKPDVRAALVLALNPGRSRPPQPVSPGRSITGFFENRGSDLERTAVVPAMLHVEHVQQAEGQDAASEEGRGVLLHQAVD